MNAPPQPQHRSFCARQPIFNERGEIWGYELLYRAEPDALEASFFNGDKASLKVAAEAFLGQDPANAHGKLCINLTASSVNAQLPYALPATKTVIELPEIIEPSLELIENLDALRDAGYTIALDGLNELVVGHPMLSRCSVIKVDVLQRDRSEIVRIIDGLEVYGAILAAKRVETREHFDVLVELGFKLFQGFFFMEPEMLPGRTLSSNEASRLKLFKLIQEDDPDIAKLSEAIKFDASISYRLLNRLNSSAYGFKESITSIKHAIVLLGWKHLRNWLRVIILTDLKPPGQSTELIYWSAQRAKFFDLVAEEHQCASHVKAHAFLFGLFSLLDSILGMPMPSILRAIRIDASLSKALQGGEGGLFDGWVNMAKAFEDADWCALEACLDRANLDAMKVAKAHFDAVEWTNRFLGTAES